VCAISETLRGNAAASRQKSMRRRGESNRARRAAAVPSPALVERASSKANVIDVVSSKGSGPPAALSRSGSRKSLVVAYDDAAPRGTACRVASRRVPPCVEPAHARTRNATRDRTGRRNGYDRGNLVTEARVREEEERGRERKGARTRERGRRESGTLGTGVDFSRGR